MCELLGMSSNVPTDLVFSLTGLAMRGGATAPHGDGWGVTFYEPGRHRTFREPSAAASSSLASHLLSNPIRATVAIAHVRRRTRGRRALRNTHPFQRKLWGKTWTFAHNGTISPERELASPGFAPRGATDSERAFCWLLAELRAAFPSGYPDHDPARAWRTLAELGGVLGAAGTFNFLLSDGERLFARCATHLSYRIRQAPFGTATLTDADLRMDFARVTTARDRVAIVATRPLTRDEPWVTGEPGTLWVFRDGELEEALVSRDPSGRSEQVSTPLQNAAAGRSRVRRSPVSRPVSASR